MYGVHFVAIDMTRKPDRRGVNYSFWDFRVNHFGISWDFMEFFGILRRDFFGKVYSDSETK